MILHKTKLRVRYGETDQMQYAYYGRYLEYFEVARAEFLRDNGLTYKQIEENGFYMPVAESFIKYKNPAFYDELLEVESRIEKMPSSKVHVGHLVRCEERDIVIAEGYVDLVFINKESKKYTRPPIFFTDVIKKFFNHDE